MIAMDKCHEEIIKNRKPLLAYDETKDFDTWRELVREMLNDVLGDMPEERCDLNIRVEWEQEHETFFEKRILFTAEQYVDVPCHLWVPKDVKLPCPVVICLQGHSTGMHISMGRAIYPGDEERVKGGGRDIAVQAIKEGYAALVVEQRALGERKSEAMLQFAPNADCTCPHVAMTAQLLGRTLIGERCWDISRAVDLIETMPEVLDSKKIVLTGNSGGGTATYYAACIEPRITMAVPSCSICSFKHSIVWKRHCVCNYVPRIAKYVDMGELACLIAPRPLVILAGVKDHGFHIDGSREVFEVVQKIYDKVGAGDKCRFCEGDGGHEYYPALAWPLIHKYID